MKPLEILSAQANVPLTLDCYLPYLNQFDENRIKEAVNQKSKRDEALNLLKAFLLEILAELQHSPWLWGESHWQSLFKQSQSALEAKSESDQLRMDLQQADKLILLAGVTEQGRRETWQEVTRRQVLSDTQAEQYELIRHACFTRQEALNALENSVEAVIHDIHPLIEPTLSPSQSFSLGRSNDFESAGLLRPYDTKTAQMRFSEAHLHHQIRCEGNARTIYQNLTQALEQKPVAEKMAEEIGIVKTDLQHRAEQLEEKVVNCGRKTIKQMQFALKKNAQVTQAHTGRIKHMALLLATLIQSIESQRVCGLPLLNLMTEAKELEKNLPRQSDGHLLQEKLLAMNTYRCTFEESITSFRATLFSNRDHLKRQQQLNQELQTILAQLVIPICGFEDKNQAIPLENVKKLKSASDQLLLHEDRLAQERNQINQIKNIFTV